MKPLKDVLNKRIKELGLSRQTEIVSLLDLVRDYLSGQFGEEILETEIKGFYIKNNILHINCANQALKQEICLKKREILALLSDFRIKDVIFVH